MLNRNCGEANTLAVQTTPGWWADKIVTPAGRQGMTGHKTAFRGVLQLTYTDGTTETFGTNTTDWLAGEGGPVTHADISTARNTTLAARWVSKLSKALRHLKSTPNFKARFSHRKVGRYISATT